MSKRSNTLLHVTFTFVVLFLALFSIQPVIADDASEVISSAISMPEIDLPALQTEALAQLPISFTENVGQAQEEIAFVIQSAGYLFGFTYDGFYFIPSIDPSDESIDSVPVTKMTVEGADPNTIVRGTGLLPGVAHYFTGSDESDWITDVPTYEGITYDNVLPGIELSYSGTEGILKREFLLEPGITPESIVLVYEGVEKLELADDGTLLVHSTSGIMSESAPVSYQVVDGVQTDLESSFVLLPENKVSFYVDGYDPDLPLVIDPFLHYSTLLGGSVTDVAYDMAVDGNGNVFLVGATQSSNFPIKNPLTYPLTSATSGANLRGTTDVFVTMITQQGTGNATIQFSTYLGGSASDIGRGIALDLLGNVYVTGETMSSNFPVRNSLTDGATYRGGDSDAFVTKILSGGGTILYSTYIGGNGKDVAYSIAVDSRGDAYITGETRGNNANLQPSSRYPTTTGAYQKDSRSVGGQLSDAFVSMIRQSGSNNAVLAYSTYLSGNNVDVGKDLAVDSSGMVYVVGTTSSSDLIPSGLPGYSNKMSAQPDAFVFKLDPSAGKQPVYATYLGGKGRDEGEAIALSGNTAYITGTTTSTDFPKTDKGALPLKYWQANTDTDIFVSQLNPTGDLVVSTYLGGSKHDGVYDISVSSDSVYIAGWTESIDYQRGSDTFKGVTSAIDAVVTGFNLSLSEIIFSTNFGGHWEDRARAVHVSESGEVYVAGYTNSKTFYEMGCDPSCWNEAFPVLRWVNQTDTSLGATFSNWGKNAGGADAFVMKFTPAPPANFEVDFEVDNRIWFESFIATFTPRFYSFGTIKESDIVSWTWTFGDGKTQNTTTRQSVSNVYNTSGKYPVQLTACTRGGICATAQKAAYVIVEDPNPYLVVVGNPINTPRVYVLENTSFDMRWNGIGPQPDRIVWEFWEYGGGKVAELPSESTTLNVPKGLPPGLYSVFATPYYFSDGEMLKGKRIVQDPYLEVLPLPKIQFSRSSAGPWSLGPFPVEKPDTGAIPAVWMQLDPAVGARIIRWYYDDTPAITDNTQVDPTSHTYTRVGEYFPTVDAWYPSIRQDVRSQPNDVNKVVVFDRVEPDFYWYPEDPMEGEAITFFYSGTGTPIAWEWNFDYLGPGPGPGIGPSPESTLENPSHAYKTQGTYYVLLRVTDPAGLPKWRWPTKRITVAHASPDLVRLTWDPKPTKPLQLFSSSPSEISLILDWPKLGLDTFQVTATITDTKVAGFTGKGKAPDWMGGSTFGVRGTNEITSGPGRGLYQSVTVYGVSPSIGNMDPISLGKIEIQGIADGDAKIVYSNPQIGYGPTGRYRVSLDAIEINMQTLTFPKLPYPEMKGPQADLNGDGLVDDFDGNGVINTNDVRVFFNAYTDGHLNKNYLLYDYNKNGRLDLQDILVYAQKFGMA